MMYNGGAKLKVKVVRQAVSHLTAFYASYTSRLNLSLEDLKGQCSSRSRSSFVCKIEYFRILVRVWYTKWRREVRILLEGQGSIKADSKA